MLSVFELYKIVGAWCDEEFGTCNVESKTSGDGESMHSFYYHCLHDPDCYVDIGAKMNGAETCTSIWSHNTDNVHIQLFRDGSVGWNNDTDYYYEFCGEKEMKKLYEIIQHAVISSNIKDTKKHPLQNSPTFPEEESVEEKQYAIINDELAVVTEDKTWMKPGGKFDKPIDPFKMVPIFDVDKFEEGYPYVLKNLENGKMGIVTLHCKSTDSLCFNYWDNDGEDAVMSYSVSEFQGAFELYKINEL